MPDLVVADVARARFETERELVGRLGGGYVRLPTPDHGRMDDRQIDVLVALLRVTGAKRDTTVLFHCHGELGRNTLAMTMADMLVNSWAVKVEDVVDRQIVLRRRAEAAADAPGKMYKAG